MKKFISALLSLCLLLSFTGCGKKKNLGFDIASGLNSFDPQLAATDSELMLVENCFQGLMDRDENGNLICGAAENYTVSDDGLVYTFYLREGLVWNDGETPVTADDFLFAFQRLFSPETNAPSRSNFFNILNSEDILNKNKLIVTLGVAVRGTLTIEFTLKTPDPMFPSLLTGAAAMPCNREFFENTKGRYGTGKDYIIFNGAYYLRRINNFSYVLSPNVYSPIVNTEYDNVYLFVKDNPKAGAVERLLDETVDAAVIDLSDIEALTGEGFTIKESENTTWVLAFNTTGKYLSNTNIRKAIAYSVDKSMITAKLGENFRQADAFVPCSVTVSGKNYRETVGESFSGFEYDTEMASDLFRQGLSELGISKIPTLTVICTEEFIPAMGYFQKSVQDNLAVFINLVHVSESELADALADKNYDMALVAVTPGYDSPNAVFSQFSDKAKFTGFYSRQFNSAVNTASRMSEFEEMADGYSVAEQMLLQNVPALPLFYETTYFAVSKSVSGIDYSVFGGHISFRFCK